MRKNSPLCVHSTGLHSLQIKITKFKSGCPNMFQMCLYLFVQYFIVRMLSVRFCRPTLHVIFHSDN
jgi:hypothetical protein